MTYRGYTIRTYPDRYGLGYAACAVNAKGHAVTAESIRATRDEAVEDVKNDLDMSISEGELPCLCTHPDPVEETRGELYFDGVAGCVVDTTEQVLVCPDCMAVIAPEPKPVDPSQISLFSEVAA